MAAEKKIKKIKKKSRDSFLAPGLSFLILFPMLLLMMPTAIFLFFSMLPTFAALISDTGAGGSKVRLKYKWLCIGGLNFSGALPFLFQLWFGDNSLDGAFGLFVHTPAFFVIYGSAAIGWIFYRCIPPIVLSFLEMSDQRRVVHLREMQTKLIEKWGEEVTVMSKSIGS